MKQHPQLVHSIVKGLINDLPQNESIPLCSLHVLDAASLILQSYIKLALLSDHLLSLHLTASLSLSEMLLQNRVEKKKHENP